MFRVPYDPFYFRAADIIIICFDVTDEKSFRSCSLWLEHLNERRKMLRPNCVVLASGNKTDRVNERLVSSAEAHEFFSSLGMPYFETSAKTREGVDELLEAALRYFLSSQNENTEENTPADGNTPVEAQGGWCTVS